MSAGASTQPAVPPSPAPSADATRRSWISDKAELCPPLISVITPSFNQARFVERCIRCVLDQQYANFEHLVADNCSTDGTLDVLRRYPHLKWVSEPDEGQSDALNRALGRARGEIIAWLNADDFYLPGTFQLAARELCRDTGVMVIAGAVQVVDADGRVSATVRPHFDGFDRLVEFWRGSYGLCQPGVLLRREVFERCGQLRPDLHYAMDYEFWLRVARHWPIHTVDAVLAGYVMHADSKTVRGRARMVFWDELESASRAHWGPALSLRRWRRALSCSRAAAEQLTHAVVSSHKHDEVFDWSLLWRLARRWPPALLRRHVMSTIADRLIGRGSARRVPWASVVCPWLAPHGQTTLAHAIPDAPRCRSGSDSDGQPRGCPGGPRAGATGNGRVTVVIPAYNREAYVGRAIRSALAQTAAARCDVVVVDDGSTDGTPAVVGEFGGRVACLRQANAGPSAARNAGARSRDNEFVAFLDSDDEWAPDKIARQLAAMSRWPDAVLVAGRAVRQHADGGVQVDGPPSTAMDCPADFAPALFERPFLVTSTIMVRRRDLLAAGGFPRELRVCEDAVTWLRLACRGPAVYLDASLATYHAATPGALTRNSERLLESQLRAWYRLRPLLKRRPDCRKSWQRGLDRTICDLRDLAWREGRYATAFRHALRASLHAPLWRKAWEWRRLVETMAAWGPGVRIEG